MTDEKDGSKDPAPEKEAAPGGAAGSASFRAAEAKRILSARKATRLLETEARKDTFLIDWLSDSRLSLKELSDADRTLDAPARQQAAELRGYRTWHHLKASAEHMGHVLESFTSNPVYKELWSRLKACDKRKGTVWLLYGPHNAGVPAQLIAAIDTWHKTPKLTAAELAAHKRKVIVACDRLAKLLGEVSPGTFADPFYALSMSAAEANAVFRAFDSPTERKHLYGPSEYFVARAAGELLRQAGVTPIWAVRNISASAANGQLHILPTKVRGNSAFQTFMIRALCDCLSRHARHEMRPVDDRLVAQVVSLIVGTTCSSDDVRKTMASRGAEDSAE